MFRPRILCVIICISFFNISALVNLLFIYTINNTSNQTTQQFRTLCLRHVVISAVTSYVIGSFCTILTFVLLHMFAVSGSDNVVFFTIIHTDWASVMRICLPLSSALTCIQLASAFLISLLHFSDGLFTEDIFNEATVPQGTPVVYPTGFTPPTNTRYSV